MSERTPFQSLGPAVTLSVPRAGVCVSVQFDGEGATCLGIDVGAAQQAPGAELLRIDLDAAHVGALRPGFLFECLRAAQPILELAWQTAGIEAPVGGVIRATQPCQAGDGTHKPSPLQVLTTATIGAGAASVMEAVPEAPFPARWIELALDRSAELPRRKVMDAGTDADAAGRSVARRGDTSWARQWAFDCVMRHWPDQHPGKDMAGMAAICEQAEPLAQWIQGEKTAAEAFASASSIKEGATPA